MDILEGTDYNFNDVTNEGLILIDFYADWCGPCKMMKPSLEQLAEEHDFFQIVQVDVEESKEIPEFFGITNIPTLVLYENGEVLDQKVGFIPKQKLLEWISGYSEVK